MGNSNNTFTDAEVAGLEVLSVPISKVCKVDPRIEAAVYQIHSNLDLPVVAIARSVNLSPSRFRHIFRIEVGMSVGYYIRLIRLGRAQRLLLTTFLSVKEVTARVGAKDVSHFVRDYKAHFGHTPLEERMKSLTPAAQRLDDQRRKAS